MSRDGASLGPVSLALIACSLMATWAGCSSAASAQMVDPAIDASGPFSYLSKPSTCIGVMAGPEGSQITFDGAVYTGRAELCFFYGQPLRPVMVRQKELLEGWIPVVQYAWRDESIRYAVELFAANVGSTAPGPDVGPGQTVNFARVTLRNMGPEPASAVFAAATRFSGQDHRCDAMITVPFSPLWRYEMTDDSATREGRVVYWFPRGARRQAVPGQDYTAPFVGRDCDVSERAEVCVAEYRVELPAGAEKSLVFKMPIEPVLASDSTLITSIRQADYEVYRRRTVDFWHAELAKGTQISVPEDKVVRTHRASLVYDLIAIDQEGDEWVQKVNELHYDHFWLRDATYIVRTYDLLGHHETAARCLEHFLRYQQPDGLFISQAGQLDGFGQALFALGQHYVMTGDLEYANRVYKHFPPAVDWLKKTRAADEYHLMPPTDARDNEFIQGRYTGHNFWALHGLRMAVLLARATGHDDDAKAFLAEYDDFRQALLNRLDKVCGPDGYIPPGLDVQGGRDWGNLLGVFPCWVLDPTDARVTATLEKMHREKYQEGIMTYDGLLHPYLTVNVTQTHVLRQEVQQALTDFYHLLLHTGSTQEGFESSVRPWGDRDSNGNYPPHGWFAAQFNALLRNMLVQERGGAGGLDPRELHLFSVLSPAWVIPGEEVAIRNAPTEMGLISASFKFTDDGAEFTFESKFRVPPASIVLHIPPSFTLAGYDTDSRSARPVRETIVFGPDMTKAVLRWMRDDSIFTPISYGQAVEQYKREYARRYEAYLREGKKPVPVEPPALLTAEQRKKEFAARWAPERVGIAVGKPVTASGGTEPGHGPELAVDGNAADRDHSSWWAGPPTPRSLQIDLESPTRISQVHVFPYWDGQRYCQYTVEVSRDGQSWSRVADMSQNTNPATDRGDVHSFDAVETRYVRVNMLHDSANPSVHLVEVRVFP